MGMVESTTTVRSEGGSRVLVTGAHGFTGMPMCRELERAGYEVISTVLEGAGKGEVDLDIASADACRSVAQQVQPDFVVNLAGISFLQHPNPADFYRVNVVGTMNLLHALADAPRMPRKVLIVSSANIYGQVGGDLIAEDQPPAPVNHYAASKVAMELMAATLFARLPIVITRPFNYTGPGQGLQFLVPKIVSHFARRAPVIELGNIDVERDFSDVAMVVDAYRRLLESEARSVSVNICTGRVTSLRSVIGMMEEIAGYRIEVRVNPQFVRSNDILRLSGNPRALIDAIGPLKQVPLHETLEHMYQTMQGSALAA